MPREPEWAPGNGAYDNPWLGADGWWYFYDETSDWHGPFPSCPVAAQELRWYIAVMLDGTMTARQVRWARCWRWAQDVAELLWLLLGVILALWYVVRWR
jgi:hypothetical protein